MQTASLSLTGTTWNLDASHSNIEFAVKHMMLATVKGRFAEANATVMFGSDEFMSAQVNVEIDVASIDTRSEQRDGHLRSADFFDAEQFPKLTFVSRDVAVKGADEYELTGDLTIRGVTREVVLKATFEGEGQDPWGGTRMAFSATGRIDRKDFGLTWNQALETGGILVGEDIKLSIEAEFVRA